MSRPSPIRRRPAPERSEKEQISGNRLFLGQIANDAKEEELTEMLSKYGTVQTIYYNKEKHFAFVSYKTRDAATKALRDQESFVIRGKSVRLRRAAHKGALWVGEINPCISNELLREAFSMFGQVERAVVVCDEHGTSQKHGVVEFVRKRDMERALQQTTAHPFLIGRFPKPVVVKPYLYREQEIGLISSMVRTSAQSEMELSVPPRFPNEATWEHDLAKQWQKLQFDEKAEIDEVKARWRERRLRLEEVTHRTVQMEHRRAMQARAEEERREDERRRAVERHYLEEQRIQESYQRQRMPPPGHYPPSYGEPAPYGDRRPSYQGPPPAAHPVRPPPGRPHPYARNGYDRAPVRSGYGPAAGFR